MKVEKNLDKCFAEIDQGEAFVIPGDGRTFLKIEEGVAKGLKANAVVLETGEMCCFSNNCKARAVDAKVVVAEGGE